jgi:hypothetical protein
MVGDEQPPGGDVLVGESGAGHDGGDGQRGNGQGRSSHIFILQ